MDYKNKRVIIFKDVDEMSDYAIKKWVEISKKAVKNKKIFTVALSGGKTPIKLYKRLADLKKTLPWDKTHIFLVDERFVSVEDEESNYRMINQALLSNIYSSTENIHYISTEEDTPQVSAEKYEEDLISSFNLLQGEVPRFDLILLGIGGDGHTASLFPDSPSLKEAGHLAVAVSHGDISKKGRITLTLPVINNAENVIFLASGTNKAGVLKEVVENENRLLPAAMVKPDKGSLSFLIDERAGSLLNISRYK